MSQFVAYKTSIRNKQILLESLKRLGLDVLPADVSDTAFQIKDMYGKSQMVVIAVRMTAQRKINAQGVYSDIGWAKEKDGTYTAHVDHLTSVMVTRDGQTTRMPISQAVERVYKDVNAEHAQNTILTKTIAGWRASGKIPANAVIRKVKKGSTTQLVLSYVTA
jgi:hypothetical protein